MGKQQNKFKALNKVEYHNKSITKIQICYNKH